MYVKSPESIAIPVPVSTLGDVISQTDTNDSGLLLKIDCEGCEYPVLSSLTQQMADRISCIIFEPQLSCYDLSTLLENLRGLGFQISKFGYLFVAFKEITAANGNRRNGFTGRSANVIFCMCPAGTISALYNNELRPDSNSLGRLLLYFSISSKANRPSANGCETCGFESIALVG